PDELQRLRHGERRRLDHHPAPEPRHLEALAEAGELSVITGPRGSIRSSGVFFLISVNAGVRGSCSMRIKDFFEAPAGTGNPWASSEPVLNADLITQLAQGTAHDPNPLETALELTRLVRA